MDKKYIINSLVAGDLSVKIYKKTDLFNDNFIK